MNQSGLVNLRIIVLWYFAHGHLKHTGGMMDGFHQGASTSVEGSKCSDYMTMTRTGCGMSTKHYDLTLVRIRTYIYIFFSLSLSLFQDHLQKQIFSKRIPQLLVDFRENG